MTDRRGNLFGWDEPETVDDAPQLLAGDEEADPWHDRPGAWQPIVTVPRERKVDLWFTRFEFTGEVVEGCWWDAAAAIPDWYHVAADGTPELAVPVFACLSHWKEPGSPVGPDGDGGPGLLARVNFDEGMTETWPPEMLERYEAYYRGVDEGSVDYQLIQRGFTQWPPKVADAYLVATAVVKQ